MKDPETLLKTLMTAYEQKRSPADHLTAWITLTPHGGTWTMIVPQGNTAILAKEDEGQVLTGDLMARMLRFIQGFFNPPARADHPGQSPCPAGPWGPCHPLFYVTGFRSAWYRVEKGQQLNKAGNTNPFPQGFVFIDGNGYAKIGA